MTYFDHKANCTHAITGPEGKKARAICRRGRARLAR
jgi:hypothetical protein